MRHRFDGDGDESNAHDYPRDVEVHVSERDADRVLYGPRGEVLSVQHDRPWRGYRGR